MKLISSRVKAAWTGETNLEIIVAITNVGQLPGNEAALVFIHASSSPVYRPDIELVGFSKTAILAPGQTQNIKITLDVRRAVTHVATR